MNLSSDSYHSSSESEEENFDIQNNNNIKEKADF